MNVQKFVLMNTPDNFTAGKIIYFLHNWCKLTHDKWILDVVKGYKIEFIGEPFQFHIPNSLNFSAVEYEAAQKEIEKFLQKQIIEKVNDIIWRILFTQTFSCVPKKTDLFELF